MLLKTPICVFLERTVKLATATAYTGNNAWGSQQEDDPRGRCYEVCVRNKTTKDICFHRQEKSFSFCYYFNIMGNFFKATSVFPSNQHGKNLYLQFSLQACCHLGETENDSQLRCKFHTWSPSAVLGAGGWCPKPVSLRSIWTVSLIVCSNFWLALKWSGSWTRRPL